MSEELNKNQAKPANGVKQEPKPTAEMQLSEYELIKMRTLRETQNAMNNMLQNSIIQYAQSLLQENGFKAKPNSVSEFNFDFNRGVIKVYEKPQIETATHIPKNIIHSTKR